MMAFHVPEATRVRSSPYWSDESYGNNGQFLVQWGGSALRCQASDGLGWEHVSVSVMRTTRLPTWDMMCAIKALFWDEEDCVVQYHPPRSLYVNVHPGVLHLWCPVGGEFPMPPQSLV